MSGPYLCRLGTRLQDWAAAWCSSEWTQTQRLVSCRQSPDSLWADSLREGEQSWARPGGGICHPVCLLTPQESRGGGYVRIGDGESGLCPWGIPARSQLGPPHRGQEGPPRLARMVRVGLGIPWCWGGVRRGELLLIYVPFAWKTQRTHSASSSLSPTLRWRKRSDHFGDKPLVSSFTKAWKDNELEDQPCPLAYKHPQRQWGMYARTEPWDGEQEKTDSSQQWKWGEGLCPAFGKRGQRALSPQTSPCTLRPGGNTWSMGMCPGLPQGWGGQEGTQELGAWSLLCPASAVLGYWPEGRFWRWPLLFQKTCLGKG